MGFPQSAWSSLCQCHNWSCSHCSWPQVPHQGEHFISLHHIYLVLSFFCPVYSALHFLTCFRKKFTSRTCIGYNCVIMLLHYVIKLIWNKYTMILIWFFVVVASTCQLLLDVLSLLLRWQRQTALTFPSWDNGVLKLFNPNIISIYMYQDMQRILTIYWLCLGNWSMAFLSLTRRGIAWESLPVLLSRPLYRWWCPESAWQCQPWVRSRNCFNKVMV